MSKLKKLFERIENNPDADGIRVERIYKHDDFNKPLWMVSLFGNEDYSGDGETIEEAFLDFENKVLDKHDG